MLCLNSDSEKGPGKSPQRPTGWTEPVPGLGWPVLRGGGLFDGRVDEGEYGKGGKKVIKGQMTHYIIEEVIEKIIINKEGVGSTDEKVKCEELPELVVLDQRGEIWKEVVDEVFHSQNGGNIDVRKFSFFYKQLSDY